jgi:hypothetical protein
MRCRKKKTIDIDSHPEMSSLLYSIALLYHRTFEYIGTMLEKTGSHGVTEAFPSPK